MQQTSHLFLTSFCIVVSLYTYILAAVLSVLTLFTLYSIHSTRAHPISSGAVASLQVMYWRAAESFTSMQALGMK